MAPSSLAPPSTPAAKAYRRPESPSPASQAVDDLLNNISPDAALKALTSLDHLTNQVAAADPTDRIFGFAAIDASKKIHDWRTELSQWQWPAEQGFEPPAKRRKLSRDLQTNDEVAADGDVQEYWGSVRAVEVIQREQRVDVIQHELDELGVEDIKHRILQTHLSLSRPSTPVLGVSFQRYPHMDDFTAIMTATFLRSLPLLSQLIQIMDTWRARLSVLRLVPSLFRLFEEVEVALESAWTALKNAAAARAEFARHQIAVIRDVLQRKVSSLGRTVDMMLDFLEGRQDTIPDTWLDRTEGIEKQYAEWVYSGQQAMLASELRLASKDDESGNDEQPQETDQILSVDEESVYTSGEHSPLREGDRAVSGAVIEEVALPAPTSVDTPCVESPRPLSPVAEAHDAVIEEVAPPAPTSVDTPCVESPRPLSPVAERHDAVIEEVAPPAPTSVDTPCVESLRPLPPVAEDPLELASGAAAFTTKDSESAEEVHNPYTQDSSANLLETFDEVAACVLTSENEQSDEDSILTSQLDGDTVDLEITALAPQVAGNELPSVESPLQISKVADEVLEESNTETPEQQTSKQQPAEDSSERDPVPAASGFAIFAAEKSPSDLDFAAESSDSSRTAVAPFTSNPDTAAQLPSDSGVLSKFTAGLREMASNAVTRQDPALREVKFADAAHTSAGEQEWSAANPAAMLPIPAAITSPAPITVDDSDALALGPDCQNTPELPDSGPRCLDDSDSRKLESSAADIRPEATLSSRATESVYARDGCAEQTEDSMCTADAVRISNACSPTSEALHRSADPTAAPDRFVTESSSSDSLNQTSSPLQIAAAGVPPALPVIDIAASTISEGEPSEAKLENAEAEAIDAILAAEFAPKAFQAEAQTNMVEQACSVEPSQSSSLEKPFPELKADHRRPDLSSADEQRSDLALLGEQHFEVAKAVGQRHDNEEPAEKQTELTIADNRRPELDIADELRHNNEEADEQQTELAIANDCPPELALAEEDRVKPVSSDERQPQVPVESVEMVPGASSDPEFEPTEKALPIPAAVDADDALDASSNNSPSSATSSPMSLDKRVRPRAGTTASFESVESRTRSRNSSYSSRSVTPEIHSSRPSGFVRAAVNMINAAEKLPASKLPVPRRFSAPMTPKDSNTSAQISLKPSLTPDDTAKSLSRDRAVSSPLRLNSVVRTPQSSVSSTVGGRSHAGSIGSASNRSLTPFRSRSPSPEYPDRSRSPSMDPSELSPSIRRARIRINTQTQETHTFKPPHSHIYKMTSYESMSIETESNFSLDYSEAPTLDNVDVASLPSIPSPAKLSQDYLQQQISQILAKVPANIRLKSESEPKRHDQPPAKLRPRYSDRKLSAVIPSRSVTPSRPAIPSRSATPSFTLAPALSKTRTRPQSGNPEIKLYHLSRSNGEAPIKLFVRLVGENGERVMVRVGGGWADLGEYLREYAMHHGRKSSPNDKVEIQDLPRRVVSGAASINGRSSPMMGESPSERPASALGRPRSSLNVRKTRPSASDGRRDSLGPTTPLSTSHPQADTPSSAVSAASRASSRMDWNEEESALGMAGPKGKRVEISAENQAWVESMKEKVRQASAEKEKELLQRQFGDLGKVGGTKRLFKKPRESLG